MNSNKNIKLFEYLALIKMILSEANLVIIEKGFNNFNSLIEILGRPVRKPLE